MPRDRTEAFDQFLPWQLAEIAQRAQPQQGEQGHAGCVFIQAFQQRERQRIDILHRHAAVACRRLKCREMRKVRRMRQRINCSGGLGPSLAFHVAVTDRRYKMMNC